MSYGVLHFDNTSGNQRMWKAKVNWNTFQVNVIALRIYCHLNDNSIPSEIAQNATLVHQNDFKL